MASPAHTAMLGVIALLVAACHPPLPQEIIEKGHIRYHYWKDDEPPCDEALEQLSARVSDLELLWQQEIPAGVTIDYFKLKSGEGATISDFCPAYAAACTVGTQIYATSWAEPHEVVHAVASTIGAPPEFMREGLAVVYGCAVARWSGDPVDPEQVATNIEASAWTATMARGSAELYPSAAALVRREIDTHGIEKFLKAYATIPYSASRSQTNEAFERVFGETLDDALNAVRSAPGREGDSCIMLHDLCDAPADAAFAGETLAVDVSCIDTSRSIEVPQLPTGQIRFTAERAGRQLSFRRCLSTGTELAAMNYSYANVGSTSAMNGRWMELRSPLAPGRYIALIRAVRANQAQLDQPLDYAGTATLQLSSVASPAPTCPNARITLADDLWWLSLETIDAVDGGVVELTPESPRLLAGVFAHGVRSISRCADCAAAAAGTCAPIQLGVQGFEQLTETTSFSIQGGADAGLSLVFDVP